MAEIVVMTKMNLTMESGLLARWYKKQGDPVAAGEPLCLIENEKETEDLLSPAEGIMAVIWATAEETYDVGTPLCLIAAAGEDIPAAAAAATAATAAAATAEATAEMKSGAGRQAAGSQRQTAGDQSGMDAAQGPAGGNFRILPRIRHLARQNGITVDELQAHFGQVAVTERHIEQFLAHRASGRKSAPNLGSGRRVKLSPMMKTIAVKMAQSCGKTARLTNFMEVDMTAAMEKLDELKQAGTRVSVTALVIRACASALLEHAGINSVLDEDTDEIIFRDAVNIGFAVDLAEGLVVPVIKEADKKTVFQISEELAGLAHAAQDGSITGEAMRDGTFTVSNVGMLGIESFTPIIRFPETAILGIGEIKTLPRYQSGDYTRVLPRKIMKIGLSYDHRVINGAPAARFMLSVRQLLEHDSGLI